VTLYVLETGSGQRSLEFFLNYTADSWLFVRSAQINIDGEIVTLPSSSWSRDNDTEIWEWTEALLRKCCEGFTLRIQSVSQAA